MTETILQQMRQAAAGSGSGRIRPEDVEGLMQAASNIEVPSISANQGGRSLIVTAPKVKPLSSNRRDLRAAHALERELAVISSTATKTGLAMQAIQSVQTYLVQSVDQAQEDMTDILYSKTRHEGMNELVATVVSQSLQSLVVHQMALAELHAARQMENL